MKPKLTNIVALSIAALLVLLSPVATAVEPLDTPDIRAAAQNATTQSDHERLARYYEDAAAQMQAKVAEKKELLEHYEDKSYIYGRRAQDLQSHTHALIRNYEKTVKATLQAAAMHRQIASMLHTNHVAYDSQTSDGIGGF